MKIQVRISKDASSAIILIGSFHIARKESEEAYQDLQAFIGASNHYVVKHCERADMPTHIERGGIVNRYGILCSKIPIDFGDKDFIPFPKGVYKRACFMTLEELKDIF